jgi:hypothetical protein
MRPCAIGLQHDQEVLGAMPGLPDHPDLMARPRMEWVVDANKLYELFAGTM